MKFGKLHPVKLGLAGGIITAVCIAFTLIGAQIFANVTPGFFGLIIEIFSLFGNNFWVMLFLGTVDAFIEGFIITWIFALLYNKLLDHK